MISREVLDAYAAQIDVMKPSSIKDDAKVTQLAKLENLYDSPEYVAEPKIDGCHYLMIGCYFFSSDKVEKTDNYPHLRDFFMNMNMPNLVLDGEINYPGKTSQFCTRVTGCKANNATIFQDENGYIHYTIWDMLRTPKGTWLLNRPLAERRKALEHFYENFIAHTPLAEFIHLNPWCTDDKRRFRDEIINSGGEGIILKNINSTYAMGKRPAWVWVKVKVKDTVDLFISGFDAPEQMYSGDSVESWPYWKEVNGVSVPVSKFYYFNWIGAIELSAYVDGHVTKICTCAGIDETLRKALSEEPQSFLGRVVKITYMETTEAGFPRHPRFMEFHESKLARECTWSFNKEN